MLVIALVFGTTVFGCDNGTTSVNGGGGTPSWNSWHTVILASHTNGVQLSQELIGPPAQGV